MPKSRKKQHGSGKPKAPKPLTYNPVYTDKITKAELREALKEKLSLPELIELAIPIIFVIGLISVFKSIKKNKAANKPVKELKTYAKTKQLKPGESETLTLSVKAADLASFDESASAWVVAEGEYQFLIAASAQDVKATLTAQAKPQQTKANNVMAPTVKMNLLRR